MKTRILFSILVLITVSCAASPEQGQAAGPTSPLTLAPPTLTDTPIPPPEGSSQHVTPTASETPTVIPLLEMSTTASLTVTGSVQIAGGGCCIGGTDGETIQTQVSFSAESPFGRVSRMRVRRGCSADTDLASADWEPFADSKTYPVAVVINWRGFYICVQFQDEHG